MSNQLFSKHRVSILLIPVLLISCIITSSNQTITDDGITKTASPPLDASSIPEKTPPHPTTISPSQSSTATSFFPPSLWTPLPKLSPEEALMAALDLYQDNGGCQLPCVWGITVGETTLVQFHQVFSPFSDISYHRPNNGYIRIGAKVPFPEEFTSFEGNILFDVFLLDDEEDQIIDVLVIFGNWISPDIDYSVAGILVTFGQPEKILIELDPISPAPNYSLVFIYQDLGMVIEFPFNDIINAPDGGDIGTVSVCPETFDKYPPYIRINDRKKGVLLERVITDYIERYFHYLEDVSDIESGEFYKTYVNPKATACFEAEFNYLERK